MLKDRIGQLPTELAQVIHEKDELFADLATSRAIVQRLRTPASPSSDTTENTESPITPPSSAGIG